MSGSAAGTEADYILSPSASAAEDADSGHGHGGHGHGVHLEAQAQAQAQEGASIGAAVGAAAGGDRPADGPPAASPLAEPSEGPRPPGEGALDDASAADHDTGQPTHELALDAEADAHLLVPSNSYIALRRVDDDAASAEDTDRDSAVGVPVAVAGNYVVIDDPGSPYQHHVMQYSGVLKDGTRYRDEEVGQAHRSLHTLHNAQAMRIPGDQYNFPFNHNGKMHALEDSAVGLPPTVYYPHLTDGHHNGDVPDVLLKAEKSSVVVENAHHHHDDAHSGDAEQRYLQQQYVHIPLDHNSSRGSSSSPVRSPDQQYGHHHLSVDHVEADSSFTPTLTTLQPHLESATPVDSAMYAQVVSMGSWTQDAVSTSPSTPVSQHLSAEITR